MTMEYLHIMLVTDKLLTQLHAVTVDVCFYHLRTYSNTDL